MSCVSHKRWSMKPRTCSQTIDSFSLAPKRSNNINSPRVEFKAWEYDRIQSGSGYEGFCSFRVGFELVELSCWYGRSNLEKVWDNPVSWGGEEVSGSSLVSPSSRSSDEPGFWSAAIRSCHSRVSVGRIPLLAISRLRSLISFLAKYRPPPPATLRICMNLKGHGLFENGHWKERGKDD